MRIIPVWKTLGMRATGSHDVMIDGHVVPDAAVALKRKAGEWHLVFHTIAMIAFPLIYSVYLGVAESARDIALELARKRRPDPHVTQLAGRMETELRGAQLAQAAMLAAVRGNKPGPETTNEIMIGRHLVAQARHRRGRAGDGNGGRRGLLPRGGTGAAVPRHPGRALPPDAGRAASDLRGQHRAGPAGRSGVLVDLG